MIFPTYGAPPPSSPLPSDSTGPSGSTLLSWAATGSGSSGVPSPSASSSGLSIETSSLPGSAEPSSPTPSGSYSVVTSETVSVSTVSTSTISMTAGTESLPGGYSWPGSLTAPTSNTLVPSYPGGPAPTEDCGKWIGVEVIVMVDVVEICPDGQTCE